MHTIELLKDSKVIEEIHRHLWIESEKAGYDRGLEWAAENWLNHYAKVWMNNQISSEQNSISRTLDQVCLTKEPIISRQNIHRDIYPLKIKKRRAKSYISF